MTSDHGEAFGEHGQWLHGGQLYDENTRVPFIWHAPGLIPAGRRVTLTVAGLIDIVPTLVELLGFDPPGELQGQSLAAILTGHEREEAQLVERVLYTESITAKARIGFFAARTSSWKIIFGREGVREMYLLADDPGERSPQSGEAVASLAARARSDFEATCRQRRATLVEKDRIRARAAAPRIADPDRELKLRALGYVQ